MAILYRILCLLINVTKVTYLPEKRDKIKQTKDCKNPCLTQKRYTTAINCHIYIFFDTINNLCQVLKRLSIIKSLDIPVYMGMNNFFWGEMC